MGREAAVATREHARETEDSGSLRVAGLLIAVEKQLG